MTPSERWRPRTFAPKSSLEIKPIGSRCYSGRKETHLGKLKPEWELQSMAKRGGLTRLGSMKSERELIELAKTKTLEALADHFQRPPKSILRKAKRLGLSIKRDRAKGK